VDFQTVLRRMAGAEALSSLVAAFWPPVLALRGVYARRRREAADQATRRCGRAASRAPRGSRVVLANTLVILEAKKGVTPNTDALPERSASNALDAR